MIEVRRTLFVFKRWWWLLLAALLIGGLLAYGATKLLVKQQYEATATVAMAPPPQGPNGLYIMSLAASADAQLVSTRSTALAAIRQMDSTTALIPASHIIDPDKLATDTTGSASLDGQLLFVSVRWPDAGLAVQLANAVAAAYVRGEQARLEERYRIIHAGDTAQENHLLALSRSAPPHGSAASWLQAQYADAASKVYQQDADARIQASTQEASLQVAQPAVSAQRVGPKATVNGLLGAVLAFLVALVFAFFATDAYGELESQDTPHPILTKVGE